MYPLYQRKYRSYLCIFVMPTHFIGIIISPSIVLVNTFSKNVFTIIFQKTLDKFPILIYIYILFERRNDISQGRYIIQHIMKKIISTFLVASAVLTQTAFAEGAVLSDSQQLELYNYGIMVGDENGDLRLSDTITRAEAVKLLCCLGNIEPVDDANAFPDVSAEHWAYKYIAAAKAANIAAGDENGNFNPNSNVTNEEMEKMLVCLLGCEARAIETGGFPAGYTSTAEAIGVTKGLAVPLPNTPAVRGDVAVMVSNSLDIPLMTVSSFDTETNSTEFSLTAKTLRDNFIKE